MTVASFDIGFVNANQSSQATLSAGVYSLSARSNVPFVTLVGRSGFQKTFSWGEIVEVPHKEQCTVKNSSFHSGDIFINGGADYDTRPAAISVPVPVNLRLGLALGTCWTPDYPADVRMARRAYFSMNAFVEDEIDPGSIISATVLGKRVDGSHNTTNDTTLAAVEPGTGYSSLYDLPHASALGLIPLGFSAMLGDDTRPHILLTTAQIYLLPVHAFHRGSSSGGDSENFTAYYVMEY